MPPTEAEALCCGSRVRMPQETGLVFNGAGIHNDEARRRSIRKSVSFCQEDVPRTSLALVMWCCRCGHA